MLRRTARAFALSLFVAGRAGAQTVNIWPGAAPGSETWTQEETTVEDTPVGSVVFNVVTPTLTAYLPEMAKATGTGLVIAPGGAFVALAIDLEGRRVAAWLQERGVAAFVLKYRIMKPSELPPIFLAWAQDDDLALGPVVTFHDALIAAGHKPEVHVYGAGGHGFGMKKQGTTSDHWIDAFYYWLEARGLTKPAAR
jgi:acetyl esterase/lipase